MGKLTSKLTKREINKKTGKEEVRCALYGEPPCRKRRYRCQGCPVFQGMLQELEALEEYYIDYC